MRLIAVAGRACPDLSSTRCCCRWQSLAQVTGPRLLAGVVLCGCYIVCIERSQSMELVSVVIPTFNSEGFIEEAIDSVVAQKYPSIEIIVVDDRSNDNSVAVARHKLQRSADRFQILELDANKGPSGARNAGLRVANGSWVQFLDSDDVLSPQKIKRQMAVSEIAEPDVAAIYSPWNWGFLEAGKIEWFGPLNEPSMSGRAPIMCLAAKCRPLLGACLICRSVLEQAGGFARNAPLLGMRRSLCKARFDRALRVGFIW